MQLKIIFQCLLCAFCVSVSAQTDLIPFRKGNLWGFCKPDKTMVVPCQYDEVRFFENRKALIRKGLLYGLLNDAGKEIVPCQYYNPIEFHEGLAKVAKDTCVATGTLKEMDSLSIKYGITKTTRTKLCNYGFINEQGEIVIPCIYTEADDFQEGYAFVNTTGGHYELSAAGFYTPQELYYIGKGTFINKKGVPIGDFNITTSPPFPRFRNGIALVPNAGKWGVIDTQNNIIVPFIYKTLSKCNDKTYIISFDSKQGLITKSGKEIVPPIYDAVYNMGSTIMVSNNYQYGLLDSLGKMLLPCIYKNGFSFSEGLSPIVQNKKYGFINEKGKIVIPCRYDDAGAFRNGRATVESGSRTFQIDALGNYADAEEPNKQYWAICEGETCQIEDKTGKIVLPADKQQIEIVKDNFAKVVKNNLHGLFDIKKQQFILPCAYSIIFVQESENTENTKNWVFVAHQNHLLGLVNSEGKRIADCEYDENRFIEIDPANHLVQISKNKKFGCLDIHTGKIRIPFTYDKPFLWEKGQSIAQKNGKMGILDAQERIVLPIEYQFPDNEALFYTEGLAPIYQNGKMGFMDSAFQMKIPLEYDEPYRTISFQNGIAPVAKNDLFGFINRQNKAIVPLQYADAHEMQAGRACIHTDTHTQFIDSLGKPVTDWILGNASPYRNQVSILKIAKDTQVLINWQGKPISKKYHHIEFFNDSLLLVKNGQFGLMNLQGMEIVPTIYQKIDTCNSLFYRASKDGKNGFISKNHAQFVLSDDIPKPLNGAYVLRTGHEAFMENWGLIDSAGQTLIPMQQTWITTLEKYFMFFTYKNGIRGTHLIDRHGKTGLEGEYNFTHTDNSGFYYVINGEKKVGLLNLETFEWIFPCTYDGIVYIKKDLYKIVNKGITYYAKDNKTIYYEN